jgi:hypothetical protein
MKRNQFVALSLVLMGLTATQVLADTIDSFTTRQSLVTAAKKNESSVVAAPEALGGKRKASLILFDAGPLSMTIGGGQAAYQLVGSGGQGAQIGWLWYVDPSAPVKPVDLTSGGKFDAFQIEVLEMTEPIVVQIDALDADNRFDSVMLVVSKKPGQPLIYDFSSFISPSSPAKIDFKRIVGLQVEFDLHTRTGGSLRLGPLRTIKRLASPSPKKP